MYDPINWNPGITLDAVEEQVIKRAYLAYRGNKTATASSLGISVRTLDNKLEKYAEEQKKRDEKELERKRKHEEYILRSRGLSVAQVLPIAPPQLDQVSGMYSSDVSPVKRSKK